MMDHPPPDRTLTVQAHRAPSLLRISLLGGMTLHIGDREVALSNRKARALIAYLAVAPGMRETRDRLVGLLWSETEDGKARASLRTLLHGLRDVLDREGVGGLSTDNLHVSLDASLIATDLDCALASIDRGEPADWLVTESRGADTFLRGYDDIDPSFDSWLTTKRENVRRLLIQRLEARLSESAHDAEATRRIAHALLQIDPTHEIACQHLMRTYVASGNNSRALAVYKQLWTRLEQEYDIEPSAATQELVVAIKSGTYRPAVPAPDTGKNVTVANIEDVDSVIVLAVKLAMAWAMKSESGLRIDASGLMRLE